MPPKRTRVTFYVDGEQHEIYAPQWFISTWKKFKEICDRDGQSASEVIQVMVEGYVHRKDPGNPQRPITAYSPGHEDHAALSMRTVETQLMDYYRGRGRTGVNRPPKKEVIAYLRERHPELPGPQIADIAEKVWVNLYKEGRTLKTGATPE